MIKKTITYVDFNGDTRTEDFYFNLSQDELIQLEVMNKGGLEYTINQLSRSQDFKEIYELFRGVILKAYGQKSADGRVFEKNEKATREFEQSQAFSELIMECIKDGAFGAKFIEGMIPKGLVQDAVNNNS